MARKYYKIGAAINRLMQFIERIKSFHVEIGGSSKAHQYRLWWNTTSRPMKAGIYLSLAPCVNITLLGKFKGELGFKYHLMSLASTTTSGVELRWWLETLIHGREEEGCISGPAFDTRILVALLREYGKILHYFLEFI